MELNWRLPHLWAEWLQPHPYKVSKGGRGGGKSVTIAQILIFKAATQKLRILCAREIQKSLSESVHYTLCEAIETLGLQKFFTVEKNKIYSCTGSEIFFSGLRHNTDSIKSMGGIDIVWIEEAEQLSYDTWIKLDNTIRAPGAEIWFSYNPEDENSTMNKMAMNPYPGMIVTEVNFCDNPFFHQSSLDQKRLRMLADPEMQEEYEHVWMGKTKKNLHAQILRGKWASEWFEPDTATWHGPYFGCDWGFAKDPTALIKTWIHEEKLYIEKELHQIGLDLDLMPRAFQIAMPEAGGYIITADNSNPTNISYLQRNGYPRMVKAKKPKGSVEGGITRLRAFEKIVIHPRCEETIMEARLWSWKVDKLTGQALAEPKPGFDHSWDAIRYGIEKIILAGKRKRSRSFSTSILER